MNHQSATGLCQPNIEEASQGFKDPFSKTATPLAKVSGRLGQARILPAVMLLIFFSNLSWGQEIKLWGVTSEGGAHNSGTIFYLRGDGSGFTKVHDFDGTTGYPFSSLTYFSGKVWGMTAHAIFTMDPDGSSYNEVIKLGAGKGTNPKGELLVHQDYLWGMTSEGGASNKGVIFRISKAGMRFTKVHDFKGPEGANPRNSLLVYDGKFFGITSRGGEDDSGTIFTLNLDGTGFKTIYTFGRSHGKPESGLVFSHGKLWGITTTGGKNKEGRTFSINPDGSDIRYIYDLAYPTLGDFIQSDDRLYAMMSLRGDLNCGTIFTIDPQTSKHKTIHAFDCKNGRFPEGNLLESQGKLWGMTRFGGSNNMGVLFRLNKDGSLFQKILDFDVSTGSVPYGQLIAVKRGQGN